jgi:cbb3-type cytochrome oxidase subunit 1
MTVVWGILGMGLGVFIASQLVWPELNFGLPWTTFGRLRPLHTNLVIFAFGGSALFSTSYYVVQRTCQTRLISDSLAAFTFWGRAVIVGAIVTLPLGLYHHQGIRGAGMADRHFARYRLDRLCGAVFRYDHATQNQAYLCR